MLPAGSADRRDGGPMTTLVNLVENTQVEVFDEADKGFAVRFTDLDSGLRIELRRGYPTQAAALNYAYKLANLTTVVLP